MPQIISYSPGQVATVYLETKDSDGYLVDSYYQDGYEIDGYESPVVQRLIKPDFTLDGYYPQPMTRFDAGIYYHTLTLPRGSSSVGSYFISIAYRDPDTNVLKFDSYQILVNAPFGLYSATSF